MSSNVAFHFIHKFLQFKNDAKYNTVLKYIGMYKICTHLKAICT